jgi:HAD superfamily hydrolase (TIGR01509 family)
MPRGVLFDVDGTLVDTTYLHTVCWWDALRANGHDVPMSAIHHGIGMGSGQLLDLLLGEDRDRGQDDTIIDAHLALYQQYWTRLVPLPGAADLVRHCADAGLRVVLATSASDQELAALRAVLDVDDALHTTTTKDDAGAAKPSPDVVQAALEQSGLDPKDTVFVGDAMWDGAACRKAGVPFVGVSCGGTSRAALEEAGAAEVWRDPADLLEHFDDSALARPDEVRT